MWTIDNRYVGGERQEGKYVLLKDNHEVAYGLDALELLAIADALNEREENKEAA